MVEKKFYEECINHNTLLQTDECCYLEVFYDAYKQRDILAINLSTKKIQHIRSEPCREVHYEGDPIKKVLYRCSISNGVFEMAELQGSNRYTFQLNSEEKTIADVRFHSHIVYLRTRIYDENDDSTHQSYIYDISKDEVCRIEDPLFNEAVSVPYFIENNNTLFLVFESSKFSSYEIPQIREWREDLATNSVFACEIDVLMKSVLEKKEIPWKELDRSNGEENKNEYIELLDVVDEDILVAYTDEQKEESQIIQRNVEGQVISSIILPCVVSYCIKYHDYLYVSWWDDVIRLFDANGNMITDPIDVSPYTATEDSEQTTALSSVLGITKDKKVVFDAEKKVNDTWKTIRMLFDINTREFSEHDAPILCDHNVLF